MRIKVSYGDEFEYSFIVPIEETTEEIRLIKVKPKDSKWGEYPPDWIYKALCH